MRYGALSPENVAWEDLPECKIFEDPMPDQYDLLIDSSHDAVVGALRSMSGTHLLGKDPTNAEKINSSTRYQNEFGPHRFINSQAWYSWK